jgi:hypothetical protein
MNVSNLTSGSSIFGATGSGKVFDSGTQVNIQSQGSGGIFSEGGFLSGVGSFFSNPGQALGFAHTVTTADVAKAQATDITGTPQVPAGTVIPGSVFGTASLGQVAGAGIAGFGAGTLLNSFLKGNVINGTIGAGVGGAGGALAGAALGTLLFPGVG